MIQTENLVLTQEWDKTFPKSDDVNHKKVIFHNIYGISLAADLYEPKKQEGKLSAIAVSGPFGAVKEQSSGLYAQELAKRGFLTIAFDPSFTGESGGTVRRMADPNINTEDFMAAVDYLTTLENVDSKKIGILGVCGWGGLALNAAALDPRIKATVASTMYDLTRTAAKGYFDSSDSEEGRYQMRVMSAKQRTIDYQTGNYIRMGGVVDPLPEDAPDFVKDYHAYYKTERGFHERSGNSTDGWNVVGMASYMNTKLLSYTNEIRNAVMIVHGDKAHSYYMGKDAYEDMLNGNQYTENKFFVSVSGASHTDLYDQMDKIPFDRIQEFFETYLK